MNSMIRSTKKILAVVLAAAMIAAFLPMTQETAYAAKAKKPAQVKSLKVDVAEDNQVTVTWKKAKNAKKYTVSIKDGTTGLTASKSSKKTKLTFKGGNAVKYTVKVQGVNGKKKGKFSKAVSKETNDLVKAAQTELETAKAELEQVQKDKEAAEKEAQEAKAAVEAAKKELADTKAAAAVETAIAGIPDAEKLGFADVEDVKAARAAYNALTDEQKLLIGEDFLDALEDAEGACDAVIEIHTAIETASTAELPSGGWNACSVESPVVTLDGTEFYVVARVDGEKALLFAKEAYGDAVEFNAEGYEEYYNFASEMEEYGPEDCSGVWRESPIRKLLNEDFLEEHPNVAKTAVATMISENYTTYGIDNNMNYNEDYYVKTGTTKDKVFLPSWGDAYKMASSGASATTEDASGMQSGTTAIRLEVNGEQQAWWTRTTKPTSQWVTDNASSNVYCIQPSTGSNYSMISKDAKTEKAYVRPMFWMSFDE